jgi:hypothetical protein
MGQLHNLYSPTAFCVSNCRAVASTVFSRRSNAIIFRVVALQVEFERQTLKPVFSLDRL